VLGCKKEAWDGSTSLNADLPYMGEGYPSGEKNPKMSRKNRIQRPLNENSFLIDYDLGSNRFK